jgi:hypothetical protein
MTSTDIAPIATMITALAALVTALLTYQKVKELKKSFNSELFSKILDELSDNKAREDRKFIIHIQEQTELESIASTAKANAFLNMDDKMSAFDRTIPRLDRVGFFIIGDNNDLLWKYPPAWLWEIVERIWGKSKYWMDARREDDRNYGRYFERLHNYYEREKNTLDKFYQEADFSIKDC